MKQTRFEMEISNGVVPFFFLKWQTMFGIHTKLSPQKNNTVANLGGCGGHSPVATYVMHHGHVWAGVSTTSAMDLLKPDVFIRSTWKMLKKRGSRKRGAKVWYKIESPDVSNVHTNKMDKESKEYV